jgi:hypothetical protein
MLDSFKIYFQSKTNLTDEQFESITDTLQFKKAEKGSYPTPPRRDLSSFIFCI